jgi:radical SAM superfamily enzyme YgiQ (UPF0313 family)
MGECFPVGLCCIATSLVSVKNDVKIFDPNLSDTPYDDIEKIVQEFNPNIVGLSIRNIDTCDKRDIFYSFKTVQPTLKIITEMAPEAKVIVGGSGFSMFAEKIMERFPNIDYGVYLEGEESISELVENFDSPENVQGIFYRRNGRLIFTGPRPLPDFDNLPIPRRDFLNIAEYPNPLGNVGIQTKRGCPQKCAYCSYPFLNGNRIRLRSPSKVVDEIEYIVNEFSVRQFMFVDGIFNKPEKHAREICHEIIKRELDVEWQAWFDIKGFSEDFLILAKKAGLKRAPFSPDAASNSALLALKKGITTKDINKVINITRKHGDVAFAFGFFGTTPGQTLMGILNTIYLYFKINFLFSFGGNGGASVSWIRIEPDTELQRIAIEEGMIDENTELLPENEEDLENLYYTAPSLWVGDCLIVLLNWSVNNLLKPAKGYVKKLLRP